MRKLILLLVVITLLTSCDFRTEEEKQEDNRLAAEAIRVAEEDEAFALYEQAEAKREVEKKAIALRSAKLEEGLNLYLSGSDIDTEELQEKLKHVMNNRKVTNNTKYLIMKLKGKYYYTAKTEYDRYLSNNKDLTTEFDEHLHLKYMLPVQRENFYFLISNMAPKLYELGAKLPPMQFYLQPKLVAMKKAIQES